LDRNHPKRVLRFPPAFGLNVVVLAASLTGSILVVILQALHRGFTWELGLTAVFLAGLSAAIGSLVYQERKSWKLLQDLRASIAKIAPAYAEVTAIPSNGKGSEALEAEIRALTERWSEFCSHCRRVHDAEMVQAEHLATLGELAAGLAHEIRNPLAGIAGAIEIIAKDFPQEHADREIIEDLREEVRRIVKVLNDLLVYSRPKPPQFGRADLKEIIARTIHLARQQTGAKQVDFSIQVADSLPAFRLDSEQLHQVLLNLVLNSIQAMEKGGKIFISARMAKAEGKGPADMVEISVSDTGPGIPKEQIGKIFRPFFTTKRGGTGLGLSLSQRIIRQHGGTISAQSTLGEGTTFTILMPVRQTVEARMESAMRGS
jgi:signal transduction histidine kinase